MVDSVGVGVGTYGGDGRYAYVNPSYASLFGVPQSELIGLPLWEVVTDIDPEGFEGYWASFDDGETREAETVHEYNGRAVPVATVTTRRSIDGTPYHFGTIKDVSERRARERKIDRQNERLENFASVVSHDLRNPVNVAQGYLDILQEDVDRDELRLVDDALGRMDVLITQLLELARSENDVGETGPVSIPATATSAWHNVTTGDAVLHTPDAVPRVTANGSRLQQLFENLFRNATEHGGSDVAVTVGTMPEGFYMADDGPGIPAAERGRVFETGYTTDENGTGFGLSIVQRIVAGHGWEIRVTDGHDGGARFEVTGVSFVE
jgi:two-component system sporulation sensor kinase A